MNAPVPPAGRASLTRAPAGAATGRAAQIAFLLALLVYLGALTWELPTLVHDARLFPVIILWLTGVFFVLKLVSVTSIRARRRLEPDALGEARAAPAGSGAQGARPALVPWLWVGGAVACMYLTGFLAGTAISVTLYLRLVTGDSWRASVGVAGATLAFAYLVFTRAMHIELDFGLLGGLF